MLELTPRADASGSAETDADGGGDGGGGDGEGGGGDGDGLGGAHFLLHVKPPHVQQYVGLGFV